MLRSVAIWYFMTEVEHSVFNPSPIDGTLSNNSLIMIKSLIICHLANMYYYTYRINWNCSESIKFS